MAPAGNTRTCGAVIFKVTKVYPSYGQVTPTKRQCPWKAVGWFGPVAQLDGSIQINQFEKRRGPVDWHYGLANVVVFVVGQKTSMQNLHPAASVQKCLSKFF